MRRKMWATKKSGPSGGAKHRIAAREAVVAAGAALPSEHYRVLWTPGVKAFVTFGEAPAAVDAGVIDFLRSRESADGIIRCDVRPAERSEVRIITGPFRGLTAIVEQRLAARDRVRVLMHLLQRETSVELPDRWVCQA